MKKKTLITTGSFLGIAIVSSISLLVGSGASTPDPFDTAKPVSLQMKEEYNPSEIPPGFNSEENEKTAKSLGINRSDNASIMSISNNENSLTLNQEIQKEGDIFTGDGGTGEIVIEGKKHQFTINSSNIAHTELKNGNNLLTGTLETELVDMNGKALPTTISFTRIVETGDQFSYVAIGTIEEGPVVLSFGNEDFGTEEIRNFIKENANIEEEVL
nr:hypothetical protein [Paenibacillus xylanexedens]